MIIDELTNYDNYVSLKGEVTEMAFPLNVLNCTLNGDSTTISIEDRCLGVTTRSFDDVVAICNGTYNSGVDPNA